MTGAIQGVFRKVSNAAYSEAFFVELKLHWFTSEQLYTADVIQRVFVRGGKRQPNVGQCIFHSTEKAKENVGEYAVYSHGPYKY